MKQEIAELEINGITYVPKSSVLAQKEFDGDIKIVILQRGWIYIGRFEKNGNDCRLHNAYCIRTWGTTKGLCELVNGATSSTKLDKCEGIVEFDWLTVVHTITVNSSKWKL
jgi:hypothetical protein